MLHIERTLNGKLNGVFGILAHSALLGFLIIFLLQIFAYVYINSQFCSYGFSVCVNVCVTVSGFFCTFSLAIFMSVCVFLFWLILSIISIHCYYFLMREKERGIYLDGGE